MPGCKHHLDFRNQMCCAEQCRLIGKHSDLDCSSQSRGPVTTSQTQQNQNAATQSRCHLGVMVPRGQQGTECAPRQWKRVPRSSRSSCRVPHPRGKSAHVYDKYGAHKVSVTFSGDNTLPSTGMPVMNNASERQKRLREVQDMRTFTIGKLECQGSKYKLA